MLDKTTFKVGDVMAESLGHSEVYSIEDDIDLGGLVAKSPLRFSVELMKIEKGINVRIFDFNADMELRCEKCLISYVQNIEFEQGERQFYFKPPVKEDDIHDIYLVDVKHQELDISEMLRQEIILHFPVNQVCSERCQGICQICGNDKNKKSCTCKEEIEPDNTYKPLAKLKDLLK